MMRHHRATAALEDGRKASYDSIGTIPRIGAQTAAAIPGNIEAYITRSTSEANAFRRRGELAFSSERYSESVRAFTVAIDIVKKLWQEENEANVVGPSKLGRALARLFFRRGSARLRLGGEDREAVHDLDQSLVLEPSQPLAFLQKGQALLNMQEHAGASRAFLGGLRIEPSHGELKRLFDRSIRGVQGSSQRYVPGWRGMNEDKPANGADDGWIPHRLPSLAGDQVHLVDPCYSREDPVVCAALIEAAVYIDLEDILEAEQEFWKKNGVSVKAEDLRRRIQLVLEDFRDVLSALFAEYCRRESGPVQPVVSRPTTLSQSVAEESNDSQKQAGDTDHNSQASTSDESGHNGSIASTRSSKHTNSTDAIAVEQPCTLAIPSAVGPYPGLLGTDGCIARLQRGGSPVGMERPEEAKSSQTRSGKGESRGEPEKGAGLVAEGALLREGYAREGGAERHRTIVEQLSMTGAQFLDLVKNCAILEGRFGWKAAASALHQVCRSGRDAKRARSEEILGHRAIGDADNRPKRTREPSRPKQGVAESSVGNPRRPQAERGRQAPRRVAEDAANGDEGGQGRLHNDKARKLREREEEEEQRDHAHHQDAADGEGKATELSREAAYLKAAEDTEGGQGAMLFPEFVEAVTRICLTRYGPWTAPRNQGAAAPAVAKTGKKVANCGAGWKRTNFGSRLKSNGKPFAHGRTALSVSAMMLSHGRAPKENRNVSVGLAVAHHRLRFAFEQHLLPEVVNASRRPTRRTNQEIATIMEVYAPRLTKIMEFFAVGGPSTAPPRAAVSPPRISPSPKKKTSKTRMADDEESSDSLSSRDGESSGGSDNSSESDYDEDEGVDRPPSHTVEPLVGPHASGLGTDGERSPPYPAFLRRRRPRPPVRKGKECRLSAREFVGMLRSLGTLDSRLTLHEACRICSTVVGFVAVANGRETPSTQQRGGEGFSGLLKAGEGGQEEENEVLLSIGDDSMGPEEFARAVFHCGDLKTWDGMCPTSQRVGLFVIHDLFERFLERTGEVSVWWTRDGSKPRA